jgi:hypothetical protein
MPKPTVTIAADELAGLAALAATDGLDHDPGIAARRLLREAIDARLEVAGLPWAPTDAQVDARATRPAPSPWRVRWHELWASPKVVTSVRGALLGVTVVLLAGGYGGNWGWTGFDGNNQLWDWLQLLVLPISFAVLPLWLKHSERMSREVKLGYAIALVAFSGFVAIGYLEPLHWTGFGGNKLWNWLTLILLPASLITVSTWRATRRTLGRAHQVAGAVLLAGWTVTLVGGYGYGWSWTGYAGNTLWDWMSLLLLPIVFPTFIAPLITSLVTGGVAAKVKAERQQAVVAGLPG